MNRIQLMGRLGRDPEGGLSGSGRYAHFSLATHEHWFDQASGQRVEHTEWHHLVCHDRLAQIALDFLSKGSEVYAEGRQRSVRWTDREGREQRSTQVRVDELRMLRHAPRTDPVVIAAKGIATVERLLVDLAVGLSPEVTLAELAAILNLIRSNLTSVEEGAQEGETTRPSDAA